MRLREIFVEDGAWSVESEGMKWGRIAFVGSSRFELHVAYHDMGYGKISTMD